MKIRPTYNAGEASTKQKRQRTRKQKQWQRFKRKRKQSGFNNPIRKFTSNNHCEQIMNPSSFWENYANVFKWQQDHYTSYWKSRAMTLENEVWNLQNHLKKLQNKLGTGKLERSFEQCVKNQSIMNSANTNLMNVHASQSESDDDYEQDDDTGESDFEIVVSQEFQEFLNNKSEGKIQGESSAEIGAGNQDVNIQEEDIELASVHSSSGTGLIENKEVADAFNSEDESLFDERKKLYGSYAATIGAMETAVRLSFESFLKKKNPEYWPSLPLEI